MKKWLIFLGGVVTGVLLTFLFAFIFSSNRPTTADNDGIKMFEKPGDIVNEESFEVFQVLAEDAALVRGGSSFTTVYLLPMMKENTTMMTKKLRFQRVK